MEEESNQRRIVSLSRQAQDDLRWVYYSTADTWGVSQAEKYISLMKESFEILRDFPGVGSATILGEDVLVYLFKIGGSRWSHGHRVFYRVHGDHVFILRVVHTGIELTTIDGDLAE